MRIESPEDVLLRNERLNQVNDAFRYLSVVERKAILRRLEADHPSFAQMGRDLGVGKQTAYSRYKRAMKKIRRVVNGKA